MGPTSLPQVVIVLVRTGPTSRPPHFHIALMGLLMVDDDLLSCKRRRHQLLNGYSPVKCCVSCDRRGHGTQSAGLPYPIHRPLPLDAQSFWEVIIIEYKSTIWRWMRHAIVRDRPPGHQQVNFFLYFWAMYFNIFFRINQRYHIFFLRINLNFYSFWQNSTN